MLFIGLPGLGWILLTDFSVTIIPTPWDVGRQEAHAQQGVELADYY